MQTFLQVLVFIFDQCLHPSFDLFNLHTGALSEALGALTTKLCAILNGCDKATFIFEIIMFSPFFRPILPTPDLIDGADKKLLHTWAGLIQQLRMDLSSNQLSQIPQLESSRRCNMNGVLHLPKYYACNLQLCFSFTVFLNLFPVQSAFFQEGISFASNVQTNWQVWRQR